MPATPDGCLCYTVQDAPVQFTKGLSRLLNGITHRLY
jgi:putative transcriptional regulator